MRRFYGYLILIVSMILVVFCSVQPQIQNITSTIEYAGGHEILYKVELKEGSSRKLDDIANIVVDRVEKSGVSNTVVEAESGSDTQSDSDFIRIKMTGDTEKDINYVLRSVEATGHITVSTLMDGGDKSELDNPFDLGSAKVNWNQSTPYVEVGIKDPKGFKKYMDECNSDYKAFQEQYNPNASEESSVEGVMVIWLDKADDDSYLSAYQAEKDTDKKYTQAHILAIVPTNNFYYTEDINGNYTNPKLLISYYTFNQEPMDANSVHTVERILNQEETDFALNRQYVQRIEASEAKNSNAAQVVLWGEVIALVVILIVLLVRYGIAGLSGFTSISVSFFIQLILFNYLKFTFSTISAVGFVASLVINASAVIVYLEKFKNELYKGKTAYKANQEANKSSLVNAVDASIFGLLITIVGILVFSTDVKTLPITICIGVACSLIINRLFMVFSMWWLTNNKLALENTHMFNVNKKDVPDIMKMEQQRKFAPLYKVEPKKFGKGGVIAASATSLGCAILLVVMALIPGVGVFNTSAEGTNYSRIEISSEIVGKDYLFQKVDDAYDFFKAKYPNLEVKNIDVNKVSDVAISTNEELVDVVYVSVELKDVVTEYDMVDKLSNDLKLESFVDADSLTVNVVTCTNKSISSQFKSAIIAVSIFAGLAILFITFRYGYVYGLSTLITVIPTALVALGFFSATRVSMSALSLAGIAAGLLIVVLAQIPLFERIKKIKRESKSRVSSYEQREAIGIQAYKETIFTSLLISGVGVVATVVAACFSPLTASVLSSYGTMAISIIIGAVFTFFLLIPVYLFLQKHIRINFAAKKRAIDAERNEKAMEKAKKENKKSSSEPEESKIPGINC